MQGMNHRAEWSIQDWKDAFTHDSEGYASQWNSCRAALSAATGVVVEGSLPVKLSPPVSRPSSPLDGVPFLTKDLFDQIGVPTRASSQFLEDERARPTKDAAILAALQQAGAVPAGRTHLNEFAYGLDGINPHFGTVENPRLHARLAGGSSSGSVWAVASGCVPFALGTDTGGSIRVPSAFCGVFGYRLSAKHNWSNHGCFPLAPSFDTAGWFTQTAGDMRLMLQTLLVDGSVDPGTGLRGIDLTGAYQLPQEFRQAIQSLTEALDCTNDSEATERWKHQTSESVSAFNILQSSESYNVHKEWISRFADQYDPNTLARILRAKNWITADRTFAQAQKEMTENLVHTLLNAFDFLVLPVTSSPAPTLSEGMGNQLREHILSMTSPISLTGLPTLCIPFQVDSGGFSAIQIVLPPDDTQAATIATRLCEKWMSHKGE